MCVCMCACTCVCSHMWLQHGLLTFHKVASDYLSFNDLKVLSTYCVPDTGLGVTHTMMKGLVPSFMERRLGIVHQQVFSQPRLVPFLTLGLPDQYTCCVTIAFVSSLRSSALPRQSPCHVHHYIPSPGLMSNSQWVPNNLCWILCLSLQHDLG